VTHSLLDGRVVDSGLSPRGGATNYEHGGNRRWARIDSPQIQGRQIDTRQVKFREGGINRALPVQKNQRIIVHATTPDPGIGYRLWVVGS
jgi:hypothetical protein